VRRNIPFRSRAQASHRNSPAWAPRLWLLCGAALALTGSQVGRAHAQTQEPSVQAQQQAEQDQAMAAMDMEARQHFAIGKALYDGGRFQQAAEEFDAAYRLSKRPQLLYNVYVANREAGNLREAVAALSTYLEQIPDAPDRINLQARLESIQAQLARQAEQEERTRVATEEAARAKAAPRTRKVTEHSVAPYYLLGSGGAILLASLGTGIPALQKSKDLDHNCTGHSCPQSQADRISSTKRLALTTDVLIGVGAATAITGLVLWWSGALDRERELPLVGLNIDSRGAWASWGARF
jgi:tetratricopeptide (TPR) repeat protein